MRKYLLSKKQEGFTLIEILLVIAIIAILAAIVIIAINPAKQLRDARNAERESEVNTILNAVSQYAIDNEGLLPGPTDAVTNPDAVIPTGASCLAAGQEICATGETEGDCNTESLVFLGSLTASGEYIVEVPLAPQDSERASGGAAAGSGYSISQDANGRVSVCAPGAELTTIEITR